MEPWLHELLGFQNYGLGIELVAWCGFLLIAAGLAWRERRSTRSASDNPLAWIVVALLVFLGGTRLLGVLRGELYFGESGLMIPNYGVAMALGFAVPLVWQVMRARRRGYGPLSMEGSIDLGFWIIVSGVAGARALSWFQHLPHDLPACVSGGQCADLLRFWSGGLVFYGGVIGSLLAGWIWCKKRGVDFLEAAAEVVPFVALGHAIGRVGCYLTGCCYGGICAHPSPMGVHYPIDSAPFNSATAQVDQDTVWQMIEQGRSVAMHPVQLYEAGAEVLLFLGLLWLARRASPRRVVSTWLVAYGVLRFCLEMIRGDRIRGFWFEWTVDGLTSLLNVPQGTSLLLTTSQAIALVLVVGGLILWRRDETASSPSESVADP